MGYYVNVWVEGTDVKIKRKKVIWKEFASRVSWPLAHVAVCKNGKLTVKDVAPITTKALNEMDARVNKEIIREIRKLRTILPWVDAVFKEVERIEKEKSNGVAKV